MGKVLPRLSSYKTSEVVLQNRIHPFFVCWPATSFLWMGYPVGLVNLCTIYCLGNYIEGRRFRAAFWCGLGTAAAPTLVFIAAALCVREGWKWLREKPSFAEIPKLILFGLLSVGGLLAFMALLFAEFHDAFVFVKAQSAWTSAPSFTAHLSQFFNLLRYFMVLGLVVHVIGGIAHHHFLATAIGRNMVDKTFQILLDFLAVCLGFFGIARMSWRPPYGIICLGGAFTILGYLWFMVSMPFYFYSGIRLCYPVLILFLGLGDWAATTKTRSCTILGIFIILMITETCLAKAGYSVI